MAASLNSGFARKSRLALLWLYGLVFFSQFKPSEPFLVDFLIHVKGFSNESISQDLFPIWTYARFPLLLLTGLFSEFQVVAGQGVLFVGAVCGFVTVLLTWFGSTFLPQQIAQVTVAANFASRFAVNAVIFQLADPDRVQQDVHVMKAVLLLSNAGSAILGEVLRDNLGTSLSMLYAISAGATGLALICSVFLLGSKSSARDPSPVKQKVAESCSDLIKIFQLPCVAWWTVWALAVNPAHGIALTYWQNLLKVRVTHEKDHNGYMLGISYLVAAAVVAACRRSSILRGWTSLLVVLSTLSMGLLLIALTISDSQWVFYALLVGIQTIYEVSTSVSTFQVGCAVCKAVETCPNGPRQPRLALLFCVTGVLAGAVGSLVQHVHPISRRFMLVAVVLLLLAALLSVIALGRLLYLFLSGRSTSAASRDPFLTPSTDMVAVRRS